MIRNQVKKFPRALVIRVAPLIPPHHGPKQLRRVLRHARIRYAKEQVSLSPEKAFWALAPVIEDNSSYRLLRSIGREIDLDTRGNQLLNRLSRKASQRPTHASYGVALRELAKNLGFEDVAEESQLRLAKSRPNNQWQLNLISTLLKTSAPELLPEYRTNRLADRQSALSTVPIDAALFENRLFEALRKGEDPSSVVEGIQQQFRNSDRLIISAFRRSAAWPQLRAYVQGQTASRRDFPDRRTLAGLRSAVRESAKSGNLTDTHRLAQFLISCGERESFLDQLVLTTGDEAGILASGFDLPEKSRTPYSPKPDSVLALLGQSLPIRSGGYATRSHGIMSGVLSRGWDIHAATRYGFPYDIWWEPDDPRDVAPLDVVDGVPYHRILDEGVFEYPRVPLKPYVESFSERVVQLATATRAALIHAASLSDVGLAGASAANRLGLPFIYEMRGLKQLLESAIIPQRTGSEREAHLNILEKTAADSADRVFVITKALGSWLENQGVSPEKIRILPNGVNLDLFKVAEKDAALSQQLGLENKTVIGYAGGLVFYEGLELLLEAAAALARQRDDFHLVIVGDGAHEKALRRLTRRLNLTSFVTFTGRVPHDQVHRYLSLFDITPFPRIPAPVCELISPIKPFEAMAMEKAVVVSDVAALTEIVSDNKTGRTFTKGDYKDLARVLGELIDGPDQRQRLGASARLWVTAERDWSQITTIVHDTYRELLD